MSIYTVREDTLLVKRNVEDENLEGKEFLEIGVGNGELSVTAAKQGAEIKGVDINPEAIEHTRERFEEKKLEAKIFQSDLFEEVEEEFDLVVFNPPYLSGPEGIGDEEMWRGGEYGLEIAETFLGQVSQYLTDDGRVWVVLSSRTDYEELVEKFGLEVIDSEKVWFETIFLFEFE